MLRNKCINTLWCQFDCIVMHTTWTRRSVASLILNLKCLLFLSLYVQSVSHHTFRETGMKATISQSEQYKKLQYEIFYGAVLYDALCVLVRLSVCPVRAVNVEKSKLA